MIHNERTRDIDAQPGEVWAVLSRFMHINEFHPAVRKVDALSENGEDIGAVRRCNFVDGTSVVEEVVDWNAGRNYRVRLSEYSLPLKEAYAEITVGPRDDGGTRTTMAMDYSVKFGPVGWLMGQTAMKKMTGKIFDSVLKGLDDRVQQQRTASK